MAKLKLKVHPLFLALGLYYAAVGEITVFLAVTFTALAHEAAHALRAEKLGYRLNQIVLMPYGAVIGGEADDLRLRDQLAVCFAGPLLNFSVAAVTMGLWWVFPWLYPYTDLIVVVNLAFGLLNLIPAFPLDGGRIFLSLAARWWGEKRAKSVVLGLTYAISAAFFAVFVVSCLHAPNPSALLFSLFLAAGAFGARKGAKYVRVRLAVTQRDLLRGKPVYRIAVDEKMSVKALIRNLDEQSLNEVLVCYRSGRERLIDHKGVAKILETADIYACVGEIADTLLQNDGGCDTINGKDKTPPDVFAA